MSEANGEFKEMDQRWLGIRGLDSAGSTGPCSQFLLRVLILY